MTEKGSLTLIIGPMYAGKTTEMFRRVKRSIIGRQSAVIIKHSTDQRYTKKRSLACSHDAEQMSALECSQLMDLKNHSDVINSQVIGIDEGQFYSDLLEFCLWAISQSKHIIVSALDSDFLMEPFENVVSLVPKAEKVRKLHAVCVLCQDKAAFSRRLVADGPKILVGGTEAYVASCRNCFEKPIDSTLLKHQREAVLFIQSLRNSK